MISEEALELAIGTAQAAARQEVVTVSGLPSGWYYLRNAAGELDLQESPRTPRNYAVDDLGDFAAAVQQYGDDSAVVFCGAAAITAILDEKGTARNRLRFQLTYTSEYKQLKKLTTNREGQSQRDFVSMLRVDLARCVPSGVVGQLRSLKFKKDMSGEAKLQAGNEAMSTEIKRSVILGAGEVPEQVEVTLRIYDELPETHKVTCAMTLDLDALEFRLIPLSGELEAATNEVRRLIRDQLRGLLGNEACVYCGSA